MATLERIHKGKDGERLAIVFVHGLGGHQCETWMQNSKDPATLWPQWLGEDAGGDVWTLAYDAKLSARQDNTMPLPD